MVRLDDRDLKILSILSRNGRITKSDLADRAGLGSTACADRLARLEDNGIITGYAAQVALRRIAPHITVFVTIELSSHEAAAFQTFEAAVAKVPEIIGCWAIGGGLDYIMQVLCPDIDAYQRFMDQLLERRIGLARYFTYVVTKPVKSVPPDLDALLA